MKGRIAELKGHFILCGLGRVGEEIAHTFNDERVPFVVVDSRPDCIARAEQEGFLYLEGDATNDEVLREAGIERARGLVAAVGSDADNTYITLSARGLRSDLFIEARASSEEVGKKLKMAGADRVILPQVIGGRRMALLALRPAVVDFIDTVVSRAGREWQMENIEVSNDSPLAGITVDETRRQTGAVVLAITTRDGRLKVNLAGEETIDEGDRLIVIGAKKRLAALEGIPKKAVA